MVISLTGKLGEAGVITARNMSKKKRKYYQFTDFTEDTDEAKIKFLRPHKA